MKNNFATHEMYFHIPGIYYSPELYELELNDLKYLENEF
jgi:hypothetical protein